MFTLKEENKENNIQEFIKRAQQLKNIDVIKQFSVVRNDEKAPVSNYDVALIFDFDTLADLDEYQKSELHIKFGEFVAGVKLQRACIDYQI